MQEISPTKIEDEKIYREMGLTDEEYERIKTFWKDVQTIRKQVYFQSCGQNIAVIKRRNHF